MVKTIIFCSYIAGKGKPENAGIIIESEAPYISCKDMSKLEKHMEQMLLTYNLLTTFFSQSQQLQTCSEQVEQYDKTILDLPNVVSKHYEQQGKEQELSQEQRILRGNTAKFNNLKNLMLELKKQVAEGISDNQKALKWKDEEVQKKWLEKVSVEASQKQHSQPAEAVKHYWMDISERKDLN